MVERILHAVDRLELFPADEIPTEDALLVREASHLGGRRRPRGQTATVIDSLCTSIPTSILTWAGTSGSRATGVRRMWHGHFRDTDRAKPQFRGGPAQS